MSVQADTNFRQNLRQAMQRRGLSQREVAKKAGTGHTFLNRVLTGKGVPSIELADRLADAVGVPLKKLLDVPKENAA